MPMHCDMKAPVLLALLTLLPVWAFAAAAPVAYVAPSDKGDFQYSEPSGYPELNLDLGPIERQVAAQASERCATPLAAAPLDLGDAQNFMEKALGNAAGAAVGRLVGGLLGGGGSSSKQRPKLAKDPVKRKFKEKIDHPGGRARIQIGGLAYDDGMVVSARVDKAAGKGTFHTIFFEQPDCTRYWPEQYLGFDLWGSWSLSVSVTRTQSTYRNGDLVDRSSSTSSWSRSGNFDFSRGFSLWDQLDGEDQRLLLNADDAYRAQLRREIDVPAWQEMGFGEPTEGIRSAGGVFRVTPAELAPGTIAVVHITNVEHGRYRTLGFPLSFEVDGDGHLQFALLEGAAP